MISNTDTRSAYSFMFRMDILLRNIKVPSHAVPDTKLPMEVATTYTITSMYILVVEAAFTHIKQLSSIYYNVKAYDNKRLVLVWLILT